MKAPELPPTNGLASSHLAFALFWLPSERRRDALLFYRFCRAIDDIADDSNRTTNEKHRLLDAWLECDEWPSDLESLLQRHSIDKGLLQAVVRGCSMDIEPRRYATFAQPQFSSYRRLRPVARMSQSASSPPRLGPGQRRKRGTKAGPGRADPGDHSAPFRLPSRGAPRERWGQVAA
jgi:hypothetical protein